MEQLLINLAAGALGGIGAGIFRSAEGPARSERWIALGSASQIALFVGPRARTSELRDRPDADGPAILARRGGDGLCRHAYRRIYYKRRALGLVCRRFAVVCLRRLCHHTLSVAAASAVRKLFHLVWHQPFILDIASTARSLGLSRQRSMNALVCLCRSSMVKVARPDFPKR